MQSCICPIAVKIFKGNYSLPEAIGDNHVTLPQLEGLLCPPRSIARAQKDHEK